MEFVDQDRQSMLFKPVCFASSQGCLFHFTHSIPYTPYAVFSLRLGQSKGLMVP